MYQRSYLTPLSKYVYKYKTLLTHIDILETFLSNIKAILNMASNSDSSRSRTSRWSSSPVFVDGFRNWQRVSNLQAIFQLPMTPLRCIIRDTLTVFSLRPPLNPTDSFIQYVFLEESARTGLSLNLSAPVFNLVREALHYMNCDEWMMVSRLVGEIETGLAVLSATAAAPSASASAAPPTSFVGTASASHTPVPAFRSSLRATPRTRTVRELLYEAEQASSPSHIPLPPRAGSMLDLSPIVSRARLRLPLRDVSPDSPRLTTLQPIRPSLIQPEPRLLGSSFRIYGEGETVSPLGSLSSASEESSYTSSNYDPSPLSILELTTDTARINDTPPRVNTPVYLREPRVDVFSAHGQLHVVCFIRGHCDYENGARSFAVAVKDGTDGG